MKTLLEFEKKQLVADKEVVRKFAILKPSQSLKEEAEEFTAIEQSNLVRKGVLTRQMLRKRLLDGEIYSENEKKEIQNLYDDYDKFNVELRDILSESPDQADKSPRLQEVRAKLVDLRDAIQNLELSQIALFDSTAEVIARNRVLFWWTLVLLLEEKGGKYAPIFTGRDYKNLKEQYDTVVEEDAFVAGLFKEVAETVTLWFLGVISSKEDFKKHWENREKEEVASEEEKQVEDKVADKVDEAVVDVATEN